PALQGGLDLDAAAASAEVDELHLGGEALGEGAHVGDDADLAAARSEAVEGGERELEALGVEGAEALVDEEGLDGGAARGEGREAEREGEGGEEGLAAAEALEAADFVAHVEVEDLELEVFARDALQAVARVERGELTVGVAEQDVE